MTGVPIPSNEDCTFHIRKVWIRFSAADRELKLGVIENMSMVIYSIRRLLAMFPLIIGISLLNFTIYALTPIDPVNSFVGLNEELNARRDEIEAAWGLNQPIFVRYIKWAVPVFTRLDFGKSWSTGQDVTQSLLPFVEKTIIMFGIAFLMTITVSTITGVVAAVNHNSFFDQTALFATLVGFSVPSFVLGLVIIVAWMSLTGEPPIYDGYKHRVLGDYLHVLAAATITLLVGGTAFLTRLVRSQLLDVLRQNYIKTARAKGLSERTVIYKHALRNALLPFVTVVALSLPGILGGSPIIEQVFNYPGVGRQIIVAALFFDMPIILAINMFFGTMSIIMLLVAEIIYAVVDPRVNF
ncbi:MAG: ABC transporter permease [Candidatus Kariarchaeaceae archaeon]